MQSSSGFGYAIICMAIWPMFMPFYTASILEAIAAFFMVIYIAVKLWKFIDWKLLLPPVIMATVTSLLGVNTLMALDEAVLSKIMGTVLLYPEHTTDHLQDIRIPISFLFQIRNNSGTFR